MTHKEQLLYVMNKKWYYVIVVCLLYVRFDANTQNIIPFFFTAITIVISSGSEDIMTMMQVQTVCCLN